MPGHTAIVERSAVRGILLTPQQEVLLLRVRPPDDTTRSFWITPGGGQEPGETVEECLRRELREELGLEQFSVGSLLWRRDHLFHWAGRRIHQLERYHVIEVAKFTPTMSDPIESKTIDCSRWWAINELLETNERLSPISLAAIVAAYIRDGAPPEPPAVEVLVD